MLHFFRNLLSHKLIIKIFFSILVFAGILLFFYKISYPSTITLGGRTFSVEVVDNKELLQKGLSGHKPLKINEGMLFVFQKPDNYGFWMKDMTFAVDILWISPEKKVIHIENAVPPSSYPKIFYPNGLAQYVLEIYPGEAEKLNIKIGDTLKF